MKRAALLLAAALAAPAHAAFYTGNQLYASCTSSSTSERLICTAYILGSVDMGQGAGFCAPAELNGKQAEDLVVRYLRDNPQSRHLGADLIIFALFKGMWPCPERGPQRSPIRLEVPA